MGKVSSLTLGIITAVGGFVDMGELVTCSQAGAQYRFALLWTVVVGVLGIMVYIDTAGRVAITSGRSLIDVIRDRLGYRLALISMIAATLVNVLTIVIEISGMALVLQIITHLSYLWLLPVAALLIAAVLWFSSFELVENGASLLGLGILIFVVAAIKLGPPWGEVGRQMVFPSIPAGASLPAYAFSAVSLLGAFMTPYEIYFYSSGAIEEKWTGKDFITNRVTTVVGFTFGSAIVISMMVVAAQTFSVHNLTSQSFSSIPVPVVTALGVGGLAVFCFGAFADTGGAALEAALSTAYSISQFLGWDWGQNHNPRNAPGFVFTYLTGIAAAVLIAFTGIDPVKLTIYTTALAAFSLPFTFIPLLIVANDEEYMGDDRNGPLVNAASIFFLVVLSIITIATIPLFILSGGGGG
ncbi:MAG TPA: Nramp family divalent metal transporter [Chloroflexota bacterium]